MKMMATACRLVSLGSLVMHFTLLISVTCVEARFFMRAPPAGVPPMQEILHDTERIAEESLILLTNDLVPNLRIFGESYTEAQ